MRRTKQLDIWSEKTEIGLTVVYLILARKGRRIGREKLDRQIIAKCLNNNINNDGRENTFIDGGKDNLLALTITEN